MLIPEQLPVTDFNIFHQFFNHPVGIAKSASLSHLHWFNLLQNVHILAYDSLQDLIVKVQKSCSEQQGTKAVNYLQLRNLTLV